MSNFFLQEIYLYSLFNLGARWGGWSTPRPGRVIPGNDPVPTVQEAGWSPGPAWEGAENLAPPGFDPRTVQPVMSRYTDRTISALLISRRQIRVLILWPPSMPKSSKWSPSFRFPPPERHTHLISRATFPAYLIFLDLRTQITHLMRSTNHEDPPLQIC
jgi:hypothetical protein